MDKNYIIKIGTISIVIILVISSFFYFVFCNNEIITEKKDDNHEDNEKIINNTISPPGLSQAVNFEIGRIHKKGIEKVFRNIGNSWKKNPSYYFIMVIDNKEIIGTEINKWDTGYVGWELFSKVKDEQEKCDIIFKIVELEKKFFRTIKNNVDMFQITYDFKTGKWSGDDNFNDSDGYCHFNGENYEIWFDVHQSDMDGDGIPYWTEVNILNTNTTVDDSKLDPDNDGIPTSWEWKWGYNPFNWDNHSRLDPDKDGLSNLEEYTMRKWLADPFHQDIYIEVDFMERGPGLFDRESVLWKESQYMVMDKFSEHDITVHIDDGWPGGSSNGGGEYLRYIDEYITYYGGIGSEFYKYHFSDGRKGIFRYLFMAHSSGWCGQMDFKRWIDVFTCPSNFKWFFKVFIPPAITPRLQRLGQAICFMHELGHTLGLTSYLYDGIDNATQVGRNDLPFFQKFIAKLDARKYWADYKSCMNYDKFGSYLLGYSNGNNGPRDFNDWGYIDLTMFQKPFDW